MYCEYKKKTQQQTSNETYSTCFPPDCPLIRETVTEKTAKSTGNMIPINGGDSGKPIRQLQKSSYTKHDNQADQIKGNSLRDSWNGKKKKFDTITVSFLAQ